MDDIYRLKMDVELKRCYTCSKQHTPACGALINDARCSYIVRDDVKKAIKQVKGRIYG
jgi:hypothetical protein